MASGGEQRRSFSNIFTNLWSFGRASSSSSAGSTAAARSEDGVDLRDLRENSTETRAAQRGISPIRGRLKEISVNQRQLTARDQPQTRREVLPNQPALVQPGLNDGLQRRPIVTSELARAQPVRNDVVQPRRPLVGNQPAILQPVHNDLQRRPIVTSAPAHAQPVRNDVVQPRRPVVGNHPAILQPVRNDLQRRPIVTSAPAHAQPVRNDGVQPRRPQRRGKGDDPRWREPREQHGNLQDQVQGMNQGQQGRNNHQNWRNGRRENRNQQNEAEYNVNQPEPAGNRRQNRRGRQRGQRDDVHDRGERDGDPGRQRHNRVGGQRAAEGGDNRNVEGPQGNARNRNTHVYQMHYKRLEEVSLKDPSEVVLVVANTRNGFPDLLKGDLRPDMIVLIVRVLAKVCQGNFVENKVGVLSTACTSKFLDQLTLHLAKVHTDHDPRRMAGLVELFTNLISFFETTMDLLPSTASEHLPTLLMMTSLAMNNASIVHRLKFDDSLTTELKELEDQIKVMAEEREQKAVKTTSKMEILGYQNPPDDFRDISIFPTSNDILSQDRAFIRPNIVHGAYQSVDHYLDVQFRLLREDFVWPLRDGVCDYVSHLNEKRPKKTDNIRIYHSVRFEGVKVVMDNMGLVVSFQTKSRIKWEYSKRFMYGALLCLTKDNFRNVLFATVMERDVKELEKGKLIVKLSEGSEITDELFQSEFIMAESEVYFEPYYHVLKALQKMKSRNFPMCQYIVYVQPQTKPPQYVLDVPNHTWQIQGFRVPVLVDNAWPSAEKLKLNVSQLKAFKSALTKEFVVIQGPPGTGKTYLGLKIARTLLLNINGLLTAPRGQNLRQQQRYFEEYYDDDEDEEGVAGGEEEGLGRGHTPMLVVCFTNHALDQFLEGLISTTQNIVRVGGQSKNEALKPFNLKEKRMENKRTAGVIQWLSRDIRNRMAGLMSRIKGVQEDLRWLDTHAGIVSVASIAEVYPLENLAAFHDDNGRPSNALLLEWLLEGREEFELPGEARGAGARAEDDPLAGLETAMEPEEYHEDHNQVENDYELGDVRAEMKLTFVLTFKTMLARLEELRIQITRLQIDNPSRQNMVYDSSWVLENEMTDLDSKVKYLTHRLNTGGRDDPATIALNLEDRRVALWSLTADQRWSLYRAWAGLIRGGLLADLSRVETEYRAEARQFEETKQMEDLELMRKMDVVGMTTTGAARLQPLLQALGARIVIVEEAAEVMESHIIVSLTRHCQHLILIGDHQQLRPTTAVYKLARDFHFDISLFERMLKNGLHCEVIDVQHRMRPEISRLIVPSIYRELYNDESVLNFKKVRGITKSVFFLTHNNREQETGETSSKQNKFEGDMMLALCRYLLLQGYPPDRITILVTYSGQMFYLRNERKRFPTLKDVQITIVDNFQGEENDIILLSLVRNNKENNVGFLKTPNRVCVALSRAKVGMYVMGNMENLTAKGDLWPKIKSALEEQGALGDTLTLRCQIHRDQLTKVRSAEDFGQVPEGGCRLLCDTELVCGHRCKSLCHAQDREHLERKCLEPCQRIPDGCVLDHPCPGRCYADCGRCETPVDRLLPCDHRKILPCYVDHLTHQCKEKVSVTPVDCRHTFDKPCHRDMATYPCPVLCPIRLECGHSCAYTCHVSNDPDHLDYKCKKPCAKRNAGCTQNHPCNRKCHEPCGDCMASVKKALPGCGHFYALPCSVDPTTVVCEKPCKRTLPCGHPCRLKCCDPCGNCQVKVKKNIRECGHEVQVKCSEEALQSHCKGPCQRVMSCGHRCTRACKTVCSTRETCEEMVPSSVVPVCGHRVQVPCRLEALGLSPDSPQLLSHCRQPCRDRLACEHECAGSCGECLQGRIHSGCRARCGRTLICSHPCTVPCTISCPPCKQKCRFRCKHSECGKLCGVPCTPCKEKCPWKCDHIQCSKRCSDMCDRKPCYEPCKKNLRCGHPCISFCGEPCPPLCRICDHEEVTFILFGNEDEEDARFVYLVDCKHTIESEGLETWLNQKDEKGEITMPKCPRCKSDIMTTLRFMNRIKQVFRDISAVKEKVYGEQQEIASSKDRLGRKLVDIFKKSNGRLAQEAGKLYNKLSQQLQPIQNKRRVTLSIADLELMHLQIDIFSELQEIYNNTYNKINAARQNTLAHYLDLLLSAVAKRDRISDQELQDFNLEVRRFGRLAEFSQLERTMNLQPKTPEIVRLHAYLCLDLLLSAVAKRDRISDQELQDFNLEVRRFGRLAEFSQLERTMNLQPKTPEIVRLHAYVWNTVMSLEKYSLNKDVLVKDGLKKLSAALKASLKISDQERKEIIKAIGLKQGHWYKCRNGHVYAIGECGRAMQMGVCPECKAPIGGSSHRLTQGNSLASEMDGATISAYH